MYSHVACDVMKERTLYLLKPSSLIWHLMPYLFLFTFKHILFKDISCLPVFIDITRVFLCLLKVTNDACAETYHAELAVVRRRDNRFKLPLGPKIYQTLTQF